MNKTITPNRFLIQPSNELTAAVSDFVPRPARAPSEISRRRLRPGGSLILEEQKRGLEVAALGAYNLSGGEELRDWARYMALAGIGTGPYMFNGRVMNRYVNLPMLAAERMENRPDTQALVEGAALDFTEAASLAGRLLIAHEQRIDRAKVARIALATGKKTVEASLKLAVAHLGDTTSDPASMISNEEVQYLVRNQCQAAVRSTRNLAREIGTFPSAAQISDPLSPLAVHLQTEGENSTVRLYERLV